MILICKVIAYGSAEQLQSVELRRKILRKPLGLDFTKEDLIDDDKQIHIGCFSGDLLIGILLLVNKKDSELKMRQVAVDDKVQGLGIGKTMVNFSEQWAVKNGFRIIILNARETAVPFYLKAGYAVKSDKFNEVGIPHFLMRKEL